MKICVVFLAFAVAFAAGQRITTIQLEGVQYFISKMNPYSPTLNFILAYQYCRSLGLQLVSFETKEKADMLTVYLKNAGYDQFSFWTSGNKLGTNGMMWMSTGLPFNTTFDYMPMNTGNRAVAVPPGTEPQRVARESGNSPSADGCVAMANGTLAWEPSNCMEPKEFICEQTRCYYYNYGSILVSATQGNRRPYVTTTTTSPTNDIDSDAETNKDDDKARDETETGSTEDEVPNFESEINISSSSSSSSSSGIGISGSSTGNDLDNDDGSRAVSSDMKNLSEDPVVGRLMTTAITSESSKTKLTPAIDENDGKTLEIGDKDDTSSSLETSKATRPVDIPDITSLFTEAPMIQSRKETAFDGLETHEVRSSSRSNLRGKLEHREIPENDDEDIGSVSVATEAPDSALEESHTVGPYDSTRDDYVNDQPNVNNESVVDSVAIGQSPIFDEHQPQQQQQQQQQRDEESSTFLPKAEPEYRYNMKWRSMGKVLDPPSK